MERCRPCELPARTRDVPLDRPDADPELVCDGLMALPSSNQEHDLLLHGGQLRNR
jgi:hypothetical protein